MIPVYSSYTPLDQQKLVGGFNPFENISQIGNLPQVGVKINNVWNHQPEKDFFQSGST